MGAPRPHIVRTEPERERTALLIAMAEALHAAGLPSHRLEAEVADGARQLGLQAHVLALPTALQVGLGDPIDGRVVLRRVDPRDPDLARLTELDGLSRALASGSVGLEEVRRRLAELEARGPVWSVPAQLAMWALSSACAAVLFGGGPRDAALSAALGASVGLLSAVLSGRESGRLLAMLSSAGVSSMARLLALSGLSVDPGVVTVASLIVLMPGYTFTLGMVELGHGHAVSGSARAGSAALTLLMLVLGVALGGGLVGSVSGAGGGSPFWMVACAILLAPPSFAVLLGALPRHVPLILTTSLVGVGVANLGDAFGAPPAGAFLGALVLGLLGSTVSRRLRLPSMLVIVPGVLLLVPGSVGFRSLVALLGGDVLAGVDEAFRMALTASALAAGLVLAPTLVPTSRDPR